MDHSDTVEKYIIKLPTFYFYQLICTQKKCLSNSQDSRARTEGMDLVLGFLLLLYIYFDMTALLFKVAPLASIVYKNRLSHEQQILSLHTMPLFHIS